MDVTPAGLRVVELTPGETRETVQAVTEAKLIFGAELEDLNRFPSEGEGTMPTSRSWIEMLRPGLHGPVLLCIAVAGRLPGRPRWQRRQPPPPAPR